jgi:hypothetical protein
VRGEDFGFVRQSEKFGVQAVVQDLRELLRRVRRRQVRATDVADEERVSGEDGRGAGRLIEIRDYDGDALQRVPRGSAEFGASASKLQDVAIVGADVWERCSRPRTEIDPGSSPLCKFAMAGDEVGVKMRKNNVFDAEAIDDSGDPIGGD